MRPVVNSSQCLREAIDLLQLVEMLCHSSQSEPVDSHSFPWNGVKLAVQESRARIEAVLNAEGQRAPQPTSSQRQKPPEQHAYRQHGVSAPIQKDVERESAALASPAVERRGTELVNGGQSRSIASRIQRIPTADSRGPNLTSPDQDLIDPNLDGRREQGRIRELDPRLLIGERNPEDAGAPTGPDEPK